MQQRKTLLGQSTYAVLFWILALLRLLSVLPFVIDDDEAWWSAASNAMKFPWDFYRSAVDHKPPGVVWFYWLVNHLIPCASDPRVIRAAYVLMTIAAALVLKQIARRFQSEKSEKSDAGWLAANLFLLISAVPSPKVLAVTADGLIVNLTIFGFGLALLADFAAVPILAGVLLGFALIIKQTAVFFCLPILFAASPKKWTRREILGFALGSFLVVIPTILSVGMQDFIYWTWTYPKAVLTTVREQLFDSTLEMIENFGMFVAAVLPLFFLAVRRASRSNRSTWKQRVRDFRVLWLVSGLLAALLGKGLFLHYLLLFMPPLALLAADLLVSNRSGIKKSFWWIGAQYVAGVIILAIPASGIFWGTDLGYFRSLGKVMGAALKPGQRVMVWGGSALPLTYTGVCHVTRFVLPRFAVAPYATSITSEMFHQELATDVPDLILDLHERGDNQFNNPLESEPYVAKLIQDQKYRVYVSQAVPWAKFYFRSPPQESAGLMEIADPVQSNPPTSPYPKASHSWMRLLDVAKQEGPLRLVETDWALRTGASLELLERQGRNEQVRERARVLGGELSSSLTNDSLSDSVIGEIQAFISEEEKTGGIPPTASLAWWPTVALVELQPKAFK